jgi:NhaP-type Na+/H+ or K+/H+ antiporter
MTLLGIFIVLVFAFSLISKRIEKTVLTAPLLFTLAGMLAYWFRPWSTAMQVKNEIILATAEITLALLLFTDATHLNLRKLLKEKVLPLRLLAIGMPLTILMGTLVGALLFKDVSIWGAALLAVILAPTDAGLGQVIVQNKRVPARIRQALSVEAGLNDGLSMPFFTLFVGLAATTTMTFASGRWVIFTLQQIGFGLVVGILIGWAGGWLLGEAGRRGWVDEPLQQLGLLSLALMSYGTAGVVGGNGFIAAFMGGMLVKRGVDDADFRADRFSEAWGQLLNFFVFYFFGMVAVVQIPAFDFSILFYSILSLTIVRILPVWIAMRGTHLHWSTRLFLGWFGPRGLASIVLGLILLEQEIHLEYQDIIINTVSATVLLSVFAHGFTALPGTKWYARYVQQFGDDAPELQDITTVAPD